MGRGVSTGAGPAFRKAKKAVLDMSTLSSAKGTVVDADGVEIASGPALYDYASEEKAAPAGGRKRGRRALPPPEPGTLVSGAASERWNRFGQAQKGRWEPRRPPSHPNALEVDRGEVRPADGCSRTRWPATARRPVSSA